jgi:hypothetical protein
VPPAGLAGNRAPVTELVVVELGTGEVGLFVGRCRVAVAAIRRLGLIARELDVKRCALAGTGLGVDLATVGFHDRSGDR